MRVSGRVATGFSKPYVAIYEANGSQVSYVNGQQMARGVKVNIKPESSEDNIFYADNQAAESAGGIFTGGTVDWEVDGLFTSTEKLIFGSPAADADGWTSDGDDTTVPYCGVGFIVRWQSSGVITYQPIVFAKTKFSFPENEFKTQEDDIDWQTSKLKSTLMRDDTDNHNWRFRGKDYSTETEAEAALKKKLGIIEETDTNTSE